MVKKIFAIVILLICAFSISNVSAEDIYDASFTDLDYEIYFAGDELDLGNDYVRQESDPSGPIVIYSDIVINGNGYVIDGSGGNIFTIGQGVSVTINDATFVNGYAFGTLTGDLYNGYGGAISNFGTLTLNNCKFSNNSATYRGGAVYNEGYLEINDSIFDNNYITTRTTNLDYGGAAICNWGGVLEVTHTNITNNLQDYVIRNGSEEYVGDLLNGVIMNTAQASFKNCNFINNSGCYGGAITLIGYAAHIASLDIDNCTFASNMAYNGAALDFVGGTFNIRNSKFYDNSAIGMSDVSDSVGGAICSFFGNAMGNISNCVFINNSALSRGGAICLQDGDGMVEGCLFENNSAGENGGAIYAKGSLTVDNSVFLDNDAPNSADINDDGEILVLSGIISNKKGIGKYGAEIPNVTYITSTSVNNAAYNFKDNVIIRGNVTPNANGIITVSIENNGKLVISKKGTVVNGSYEVDMGKIPVFGDYEIKVAFDENERYFSSSAKGNLTINGAQANLTVNNIVKYYKNGTDLKISLTAVDGTPLSDKTVRITVDGMIYETATDENGIAYLALDMLPGNYTANILFLGSSVYVGCEKTASIEILSTLTSHDVVKYFGNGTQYTVRVTDSHGNPVEGMTVNVYLDGIYFTNLHYAIVSDEKGIATLPIGLSAGSYNITAIYDGESVSNTITVLPMVYVLSAENLRMAFGDGSLYTVRVSDIDGNSIVGKIVALTLRSPTWRGPVTYDRLTDEDGVATLPIGLSPGSYTITATYGEEFVSTKIEVLKSAFIIEATNVVKYFRNATQYSATVKDLNGNPVAGKTVSVTLYSITWKGPVTYNIITDENGVATLPIGLSQGFYTVSADVGGNVAVSSIRVLPILTSRGLIQTYGHQASLTATLLDGKGNPACDKVLVFTIGRVSYNRITDENGVASLPIGLMPGSYSFRISYEQLNANIFTDVIVVKN